jgi:hypothetical protein
MVKKPKPNSLHFISRPLFNTIIMLFELVHIPDTTRMAGLNLFRTICNLILYMPGRFNSAQVFTE